MFGLSGSRNNSVENPMSTDSELLRQHVEDGSEAAFTELVQRYAGLVHAAAWRLVGGKAHLARDVTQDVFILLARKAPMLIGHKTLAGWLHASTRYIALCMIRNLQKRETLEREAAVMQTISTPDIHWEQLRPLLDEAVSQLDDHDRNAVLLRYFQGQSHREVGAALGLSEDSARVRTDRAVEKLRRHFERGGVVTTAALLSEVLSANAAQAAPPGLVADVAAVAHAKGLSLGHTLLKAIYMTTKTKIAIAAAVILAIAFMPFAISFQNNAHGQPVRLPQGGSGGSTKIAQVSTSAASAQVAAPVVASAPATVPAIQAVTPAPISPKVDPIAPMPGVYPNRPKMRDLFTAATGQDQSTGPIVAPGPVSMPTADMVRYRYGNLMQKMRFTPEQAAAFVKIVSDSQDEETAIRQQNPLPPQVLASLRTMTDGQVSTALAQHDQQLQPLVQAVEQNTTAQLQPLLNGNEDYYQTYNDQVQERAVILGGGYTDALETANVPPLTLDQEEQLVNLVYQYRTAANGNPIPPDQQAQILQQAATFISSDQVGVFKQFLPMLVTPPVPGTVIRGG